MRRTIFRICSARSFWFFLPFTEDWVSFSRDVIDAELTVVGSAPLSSSYSEVLLDCYRSCSPIEEYLRASCKLAYDVRVNGKAEDSTDWFQETQAGHYKKSMGILSALQPQIYRNLRAHQYLVTYSGILKLKRALRR
jgi:anaphase-promoting complex subunit 5